MKEELRKVELRVFVSTSDRLPEQVPDMSYCIPVTQLSSKINKNSLYMLFGVLIW